MCRMARRPPGCRLIHSPRSRAWPSWMTMGRPSSTRLSMCAAGSRLRRDMTVGDGEGRRPPRLGDVSAALYRQTRRTPAAPFAAASPSAHAALAWGLCWVQKAAGDEHTQPSVAWRAPLAFTGKAQDPDAGPVLCRRGARRTRVARRWSPSNLAPQEEEPVPAGLEPVCPCSPMAALDQALPPLRRLLCHLLPSPQLPVCTPTMPCPLLYCAACRPVWLPDNADNADSRYSQRETPQGYRSARPRTCAAPATGADHRISHLAPDWPGSGWRREPAWYTSTVLVHTWASPWVHAYDALRFSAIRIERTSKHTRAARYRDTEAPCARPHALALKNSVSGSGHPMGQCLRANAPFAPTSRPSWQRVGIRQDHAQNAP